jgi:exonuclease III
MKLRIATFNLENLDDDPGESPTLQQRIEVLRPQLERLEADVLCFQEVHGQETAGQPRKLLALEKLLANSAYSQFNIASTMTTNNEVYDKRNLVIVSRFPLSDVNQVKHEDIYEPLYRKVTAEPKETEAKKITWERPIFYAKATTGGNGFTFHLINLHLKSRNPVNIEGQNSEEYWKWKSSAGWAEGFFISSMKRVGQALETRVFVDSIFDADEDAKIVVCGDLNAHPGEVPVEAICGRVENTSNPELNKRVLLTCEDTIPEPARYTFLYHGRKNLLDHTLISKAMLPYYRGAEIHNETLHDESLAFALDTKFPESDHAPFVVEFDIP